MLPTFVLATTATASATSIDIDTPSGLTVGDLLVAVLALDLTASGNAAPVITPPAGWTLRSSQAAGGGAPATETMLLLVYTKLATLDEDQFHTWASSVSAVIGAAILAYTDVDQVTSLAQLSGGGNAVGATAATATASISAPTLSLGEDSTLVTAFWATTNAATGITPAAGMTERIDLGSGMRLASADLSRGPDEATGARVATVDGGGTGAVVGCTLVLRGATLDTAFVDNYKSKVLRKLIPPPFIASLKSHMGKLVSVFGTSDNELGGQYGDNDTLPDETP